MVLLMAAVLALPGAAQSAMWVGGEVGANFLPSSDLHLDLRGVGTTTLGGTSFNNSVIGGVTLGYDFVNSGFGGYAYPDWMKYFGFAVDYTYNRLSASSQDVTIGGPGITPFQARILGGQHIDGSVSALTFLFYGHYGLFPDSEVPSGRVHPYLGVGPGVAWTTLDAGFADGGKKTTSNVTLVTEAGLRFMVLPAVSIDLAFRYRYFRPQWEFNDIKATYTVNSMSVLTRIAYHF